MRLANLRAMCQRCHFRYDAEHHAETRAAAKAAALLNQMSPLFDLPERTKDSATHNERSS